MADGACNGRVAPIGLRVMKLNGFQRVDWGLMDYAEALQAMRDRHADRVAGRVDDAIICVEHPRVFTLGKHGRRDNIMLDEVELADLGFRVYEVERGGDVTYHGPGQAVIYPVIDLKSRRIGVRALVEAVSDAVCQVAHSFGVEAYGDPGRPGAWVEGKKLAAIGLAVPSKVTMHGVALNVNTDLSDFDHIRACGLDAQPTSLAAELGRPVPMTEAFDRLYQSLVEHFSAAEGSFRPEAAEAGA